MSDSYAWSKYGREAWRKTAERWDVREPLRADIQEAEKQLLAEVAARRGGPRIGRVGQ